MTELINGKRIGDEKTITAETIRATGKEMGLTDAEIAKTIAAITGRAGIGKGVEMTTYTPAVLTTGADERGNLFSFWHSPQGWVDGYNERTTDENFIRAHVFPNVQKVYFSNIVLTGAEWVEAGCPMSLTDEQMTAIEQATALEALPEAEAQAVEVERDGRWLDSASGAEMDIEQYRAMRNAETTEAVQQMRNGTFKLRPYSSFSRTPADPLTADEANFYGMDE